ncbi:hypothetical protein GUITHDRAFT_115370 [Guillardia theta CCMP2712]|uniref:IPT/TIG domain-containing protein n=1 Tax=Guillardia theta (strain CCMP2712) TaxID=905079 RepID=L1IQR5_GUITC|nr:hypothetical protein GUITHDRAFT_115370 [Guillardia theta CCMP2712]EKX38598.1 hypothetical protein GUITHDRAFT_115370 [Guillardia theta CCMP2712]|eukprot:XP_005825578.1 hypothetical protein GUITHDRAFT_115370 [Guillardia theta CCMP2712]
MLSWRSLALLALLVPWSRAGIMTEYGDPRRDFYDASVSCSLAAWLKPSPSMQVVSGKILWIRSPTSLVLDSRAERSVNAYLGATIIIGGESRVITAYTGDANGDGDVRSACARGLGLSQRQVQDDGDAEVWVDSPFLAAEALQANVTRYKIMHGYSITERFNLFHRNKSKNKSKNKYKNKPSDSEFSVSEKQVLKQWTSASYHVLFAGRIASAMAQVDLILRERLPVKEESLVGLSVQVRESTRPIVRYSRSEHKLSLSSAFEFEIEQEETYKIFTVTAARVLSFPSSAGRVLRAPNVTSRFRVQIHQPGARTQEEVLGRGISFEREGYWEESRVVHYEEEGWAIVEEVSRPVDESTRFRTLEEPPTLLVSNNSLLRPDSLLLSVAMSGSSSCFLLNFSEADRRRRDVKVGDEPWEEGRRSREQTQLPSSDANDIADDARSSFCLFAVTKPSRPPVTRGVLEHETVLRGTLQQEEAGSTTLKLQLEKKLRGDELNGMVLEILLGGGERIARTVTEQQEDGTVTLNQSLPEETSVQGRQFVIRTVSHGRRYLTLSASSPLLAGSIAGKTLLINGETRRVSHYGASPHSSLVNGRLATLDQQLSADVTPGVDSYFIYEPSSLLSFSASSRTVDFLHAGIDATMSPANGSQLALYHEVSMSDPSMRRVEVVRAGEGFLPSGSFLTAAGVRGSYSCNEGGGIASVEVVEEEALTTDRNLELAIRYPPDCGGRTIDVSECSTTSQLGSVTTMEVVEGGVNYVEGEVRLVEGSRGEGLAGRTRVNDQGKVVEVFFLDAKSHGRGCDEAVEVEIVYEGSERKMEGTVTSVEVVDGGMGHAQGRMRIVCEAPCTGKGLEATCEVDDDGAVASVRILDHGKGYSFQHPPSLSCGSSLREAVMVPKIAHGARLVGTSARLLLLSLSSHRRVTSQQSVTRVVGVDVGPGRLVGCREGEELFGVGGHGQGMRLLLLSSSVTASSHVKVVDSGFGYSAAPQLVARKGSCKCLTESSGAGVELDGSTPGNLDRCVRAVVSSEVTVGESWQVEVQVLDGSRGFYYKYVGGLRPQNLVLQVPSRNLSDLVLSNLFLGAAGEQVEEGGAAAGRRGWQGEVLEMLLYRCSSGTAASKDYMGCLRPRDVDLVGNYLSSRFSLRWDSAEGAARKGRDGDLALAVLRGSSGSGAVPILSKVRPCAAMGGRGQEISIFGKNLDGEQENIRVEVGGKACVQVEVKQVRASGETILTCRAPAGEIGLADVSISIDGLSRTFRKRYLYAPALLHLTPSRPSCKGGQTLTLLGQGFSSSPLPFSIAIDAHRRLECANSSIVSDHMLLCLLPVMLRRFTTISLVTQCGGGGGRNESATSELGFVLVDAPAFVDECEKEQQRDNRSCMECCSARCPTPVETTNSSCSDMCEEFCKT